ncbi:MAG: tRNA pseudouridine synthase A [Methanoregulaceae archaeon PtaB.Bin056]|nr:MAG: tRNA pseudouridine synthase A [Methanoregulaceae archaeon PtaB.Bin056]
MEEVHQGDAAPLRLAFRCGYLGDGFAGSQMQPGLRTVEGEFVSACMHLGLFSSHRDARFLAAGRTDRGVHARAQVFSFSTAVPHRAISALGRRLPPDIWITGYAMVAAGFHPRHHAISRTYRYYFMERDLDLDAMARAARLFEGFHDFSLFARVEGRDPFRKVISASVFREQGLCIFEVRAESFLWHMVRYMAAALFLEGTGAGGEEIISDRMGGDAGARLAPAPPDGLVLWDIEYPFAFVPLPRDERPARFLVGRMAHHRRMTRVLEAFMDAGDSA